MFTRNSTVRAACLALCVALAACAGRSGHVAARRTVSPGPASDPWGPYIAEASERFRVPKAWIRAVMQQESGGHEFIGGRPTTSYAGAAGLMQVLPSTYGELRDRYGLGSDPYDPHDNILAGTAYIREMADRYGAPGFLAAYNAGPRRVDDYLANGTPLPDQTVDYLAAVTPSLGTEIAMTGPLSVYATRSQPRAYASTAPVALPPASEPSPGSASEPYRPPPPVPPPVRVASAEPARSVLSASVYGGAPPPQNIAAEPPDAAPPAPVRVSVARPVLPVQPPRPPQVVYRLVALGPPPRPAPAAYRVAETQARMERGGRRDAASRVAIQLGAYATPAQARQAAAVATRHAALPPDAAPGVAVGPGVPKSGAVFRARIDNLSADAASAACARLRIQRVPCAIVSGG